MWLARRKGQRDWRDGSTAADAIRRAILLPASKTPSWLLDAATDAERQLLEPAEPPSA